MDTTFFSGKTSRLLEVDEVREGFALSVHRFWLRLLVDLVKSYVFGSAVRDWRSPILMLRMG